MLQNKLKINDSKTFFFVLPCLFLTQQFNVLNINVPSISACIIYKYIIQSKNERES